MIQEPSQFIIDRLKAGATQSEIKQNFVTVGWSEEAADSAILTALLAMGVPTPDTGALSEAKKSASTLDVVLNFFSFILLGIVATSLGMLYYGIINHFFPDVAQVGYEVYARSTSGVTYAIASLVVAFPIYVFVVRMWFRRFREHSERTESKLTKWLTYLVLLVTSMTIVVDLITALYYMLEGELSVRFVLKALTILAIASTVFVFYMLERRLVQYGQDIARTIFQRFGVAVAVFVVVGVVLGFTAVGSPGQARLATLDEKRAQDLSQLASCVNGFVQSRGRLPVSLTELESSTEWSYCYEVVRDPVTEVPYEYMPTETTVPTMGRSEVAYQLCATFDTDTASPGTSRGEGWNGKWSAHEKGTACDVETVTVMTPLAVPVK